jgi:Uma2 family endonuclease
MGNALPQRAGLSHADYFALERAEDRRYEYLAGEVFAMAGGSERHALISMNTGAALVNASRRLPCRVYGADMKLYIAAHDHFCYPDVMLLCERGVRHEDYVEQPTLIVEVLSPSTEGYDRGLKFEHYRSIEALEHYLLLDQDRMHAELYTRSHGAWLLTEAGGEAGVLRLDTLGIELALAELYRLVEFPGPTAGRG